MVPPAQHVGVLALAPKHRYTLTLQRTVHWVAVIRTGQFELDPSHWLGTSHLDHPTHPIPTKETLHQA